MAGRPREFDIEKVLVKARDAFWKNGYEGISMSDLVTLLGIASARIYAAFGSKEGLFRKAVEFYMEHEGGFVSKALLETNTVKEFVQQILLDAVELYTDNSKPKGCMVVLSAINCTEANNNIRLWLEELRHKQSILITKRIEQAIINNELPAVSDSQLLGDYVVNVLNGLAIQGRDGVPKERLIKMINFCMRLFP
ncbi:TetR/AcrR family transcriptional regulator [Entomomonas sp. E2T0]|uniref:TetR/AcrR family transcriptional regulator n=1 Tax=Entomomonas sp. E2T0 TaxID=2930213 RepID=UPI00222818D0|nr:TetR/AcrR family transcriptional regulator [Entomomonas sp. E2T0]UYZ85078.1 TetR/AcrR family transcriptional regulator [Entomomonas sp. E2T0]